jgi:hypothetical protein
MLTKKSLTRIFILAFGLATRGGQVITTVAGGGGGLGDNAAATSAQLKQPTGVVAQQAAGIERLTVS